MDIKTEWRNGFEHIYPNDIQGHDDINPPFECSIWDCEQFEEQGEPCNVWWDDLGSNNCGFDLAFEFLTHLLGDLNERVFDDEIYQNG